MNMNTFIEEAKRKLELQKKLFGIKYDADMILDIAFELAEEDAYSDYTFGV